MCLLVEQNKNTRFSDEFLTGVYTCNSDGLGVMWAENNELHYRKHLPVDAADAISFLRTHAEGKDCCWHARMKTHGNIDFLNCHPYPVFGFNEESEHPMLLMHNGVLSSGNSKDVSKSDTWHFINDYLRPLLSLNPEIVHDKLFIEMLGKFIGDNRFAIMDYTGRHVIVNRSQGVEYEGSWLSNTYAWDYYGLHPNARSYYKSTQSTSNYYQKSASGAVVAPWTHREEPKTVKSEGKKLLDAIDRSAQKQANKRKRGPKQKTLPFEGAAYQKLQAFMDRISVIAPDTAESLLFADLAAAVRMAGELAVGELIELLEYGLVEENRFVRLLFHPADIEDFLNNANADTDSWEKQWQEYAASVSNEVGA